MAQIGEPVGYRDLFCRAAAVGAFALTFAYAPAALAQCLFGGIVPTNPGGAGALAMTATVPTAISTAVSTASTAFLAQTTAFVSSPRGTQPDQTAGGIWIRGVGGRADVDAQTSGTSSVSAAPGFSGTISCNFRSQNDFVGVQGGIDLGRLDLGNSGWNVHAGVTGGYLSLDNTTGTTKGHFDVPFVGLYFALTGGGGFYVDAQVRKDFYQMRLTDSSISLGRDVDGDGWGVTASMGYMFNVGNFIVEPSVGVVYSRASIDPVVFTASVPPFVPIPGTLRVQDIETLLGRAGVRVATNTTVGNIALQPFAAASVWHEFAGRISSSYQSQCAPAVCLTFNQVPTELGAVSSTSRVGTFGQFSLGLAASVPDTRTLGYIRIDYRNGENIEGIGVNGGLRYQFAP